MVVCVKGSLRKDMSLLASDHFPICVKGASYYRISNLFLNLKWSLVLCLQVHSEREMKRVLGLPNVQLIGINNRSLGTSI